MRVEPRSLSLALLVLAFLGFGAMAPRADESDEPEDSSDSWCEEARKWNDDPKYGHHCEVREVRLGGRERVVVDASLNGGISVTGWDRDEILIQAKIETWADTDADADRLAEEVELETDEDGIHATGPETKSRSEHHDWQSWSVSYRISVPMGTDLDLKTHNGGIKVRGVSGEIALEAENGGLRLQNVAGDVRGRTTNGGLAVDLEGDHWRGDGLDLQTTNGNVSLSIPKNYSARLQTGTTNGRMRVDFPVAVQGEMSKHVSADLGRGGATVRAITTNGAVIVKRGN